MEYPSHADNFIDATIDHNIHFLLFHCGSDQGYDVWRIYDASNSGHNSFLQEIMTKEMLLAFLQQCVARTCPFDFSLNIHRSVPIYESEWNEEKLNALPLIPRDFLFKKPMETMTTIEQHTKEKEQRGLRHPRDLPDEKIMSRACVAYQLFSISSPSALDDQNRQHKIAWKKHKKRALSKLKKWMDILVWCKYRDENSQDVHEKCVAVVSIK
jgi:hypothetical protein